MAQATESLPLTETLTPADQAELIAAVRQAFADGTPIYPIGGGTSLNYGTPARLPGLGLSLAKLNRVVDYPARDMTITVEAGITMAALAATLAAQGQRLPVDVPQVDRATLGGVIATNTSGALRYGHGTVRDYVIGISAVDGRGTPFKGGGRVVKNVAGYDFCKLLTGSLGTLGVITQVTLKVKPLPERSAFVACRVQDLEVVEPLLAGLVTSRTTPMAIELLTGPAWRDNPALEPSATGELGHLVVGLEGTDREIAWMIDALGEEWRTAGITATPVAAAQTVGLWSRLSEFPASAESPFVVRVNVPPSAVRGIVRLLGKLDANCSIQAHAGNGIVVARFSTIPSGGLTGALVGQLRPAAQNVGGHAVVLSCANAAELTRQAVWGAAGNAAMLMNEVQRQFDPKGLLNPDRSAFAI